MQWVKNVRERSATHPLEGSVVQRLQRFATYGSLKQQVLRIITDELAANNNDTTQAALEKVRRAACCPACDNRLPAWLYALQYVCLSPRMGTGYMYVWM